MTAVILHRDYVYADLVIRKLAQEDGDVSKLRTLIAACFAEQREEILTPLEQLCEDTDPETPHKVVTKNALIERLAAAQGLVQCDNCRGWVEPNALALYGCRVCWQEHHERRHTREWKR